MKPKICKICLKERNRLNRSWFPNILPQLAWSDEKGVMHHHMRYGEWSKATYCNKPVTREGGNTTW